MSRIGQAIARFRDRRALATMAKEAQSTRQPATGDLQVAPFAKVSRRYPVDGMSPVRLRQVMRESDQGETQNFAELLDDIAADTQIAMLLGAMKLPVAGAPLEVEPPEGDTSTRAAEVAEAAEAALKAIPDFHQLKVDLLDAEYVGFASLQPTWERGGKAWNIVGYRAFESWLFRFPGDGETPLISTLANPNGEPLPDGVLFYRVRQRPGPVMRGGIGWSIARPWMYKGYFLVDGASFLERFGHPHVQVQVPPSAIEDSKQLELAKNAARSLIADQVGIVPPGTTLQILDTINKAGTVKDVYLAFIEWCDAALAKAFLGQSSTTDDQKSQGSQAKAKAGLEVKQELTTARAQRLAAFLTTAIVQPWVRYNFGDSAPMPRVKICSEPPDDAKEAAQVDKTEAETAKILSREVGLPLSREELYSRFKRQPPKSAEDAIGGVVQTTPPPGTPPGGAAPGATASTRLGACPGCGETIDLGAAEKKKRLQDWAS